MVGRAPEGRVPAIFIPPIGLEGLLGLAVQVRGIVLFAHGSGSGRFGSRNNIVAQPLREAGLATLLFDLLTTGARPMTVATFSISGCSGSAC
jgi:hypothetical protein